MLFNGVVGAISEVKGPCGKVASVTPSSAQAGREDLQAHEIYRLFEPSYY